MVTIGNIAGGDVSRTTAGLAEQPMRIKGLEVLQICSFEKRPSASVIDASARHDAAVMVFDDNLTHLTVT